MKQIPYGISNFDRIIRENYYYVDKTYYIPKLENYGSYLFCIRPRRFGKSLFIDMMASYYDIAKRDLFHELFSNLWIGKHPTRWANAFQVLKFDFSRATAPLSELPERFDEYCAVELNNFIKKYEIYYENDFICRFVNAKSSKEKLDMLRGEADRLNYRLYLIIDEYDNFTNTVLSNNGKEQFHALTHADGFYRGFFKLFKGMFDRIFMIGVSPITMDDLTSGYNIDLNISLESQFNSMLGFSSKELREMIVYYKTQGQIIREPDDVLAEMAPWYDHYCFSEECCGKEWVYNTTMTLYYLNSLVNMKMVPKEMIDKNTRTDYKKLRQLIEIDRGIESESRKSIIIEIANKGYVDMMLVDSFSAMEISKEENFLSLLYYYGMITMGAIRGVIQRMIIPNQSVRMQYWDYITDQYKKFSQIKRLPLLKLFYLLAFDGNWRPLIQMLGDEYKRVSSVRDAIGGEHNVQGFFKAYLSQCDYHSFCPEIELGYGYSDFLMIPQLSRFPDANHSYIIEIKYAKPSDSKAYIDKLSADADNQLSRYLSDKKLLPMLRNTHIHPIKIIFHGPQLVVCEEMQSNI